MCFVKSISKKVGITHDEIQLAKQISKVPKCKQVACMKTMKTVPSNTNISVTESGRSIVPELNEQYSSDIKDNMPIKYGTQLTPANSQCKINLSVIKDDMQTNGTQLTPADSQCNVNLSVITPNTLSVGK
eukprot:238990_1